MKAKPLKSILLKYLDKEPFKKINEIITIQKEWTNVVGKTISVNTEILEIKNKTLLIKTRNPVWRNELTLQKTDLLDKLNQNTNINNIKDIRFL